MHLGARDLWGRMQSWTATSGVVSTRIAFYAFTTPEVARHAGVDSRDSKNLSHTFTTPEVARRSVNYVQTSILV